MMVSTKIITQLPGLREPCCIILITPYLITTKSYSNLAKLDNSLLDSTHEVLVLAVMVEVAVIGKRAGGV